MGQKINPIGLPRRHQPHWTAGGTADRDYAKLLHQDLKLRDDLMTRLSQAGVGRVVIERAAKKTRVTIHSARPVSSLQEGCDIEKAASRTGDTAPVRRVAQHSRNPQAEIDAKLVAENIASQLERRVAFRRAMKRAVQSAMRLGALASGSTVPVVSAAQKSRGWSGIAKAACLCIRFAPTSITARRLRKPPMERAALRFGSSRAKF